MVNRCCRDCGESLPISEYSRNQWSRGIGVSRCRFCVAGGSVGDEGSIEIASYFGEGAFRYVYKGVYNEGARKGQACVSKEFKSGAVFSEHYFEHDIKAVHQAIDLVDHWNNERVVSKPVSVNKAQVWHYTHTGEKSLIEPFKRISVNSTEQWVGCSRRQRVV
jgi:hypothetical protein